MLAKNIVSCALVASMIFSAGCATTQKALKSVSKQCNADCQESYIIINLECHCIGISQPENESIDD